MEHKMGVVRTLRHRANILVSEHADKEEELDHLKKVLSISGYPKWAWQAPSSRKVTPHPQRTSGTTPRGHVTLPYVGGITEPISRRLRKVGVAAHARPYNTIRRLLVAPKDKVETLDKCGVVYHLSCKDCEAQYIGETERALKKRLLRNMKRISPW
jgi:hypothetical protein